MQTYINDGIFELMRNSIIRSDICNDPPKWAPSGIETNSHLTVFYGIPDEVDFTDEETKEAYTDFFKDKTMVTFQSSKVSCFSSEEHDCIIIIGEETDNQELKKLHEDFKSHFNYESTHDEYIPHITIGYVKPGLGEKYVSKFNTYGKLISNQFRICILDVFDENRNELTIRLK